MKFPWLHAVYSVLPLALSVMGVPSALIPVLVHGIEEAESLPHASSADKKAHVLEMVNTAIRVVNTAKKAVVIDPSVIMPIVDNAIDVGILIANQLSKHGRKA